MAMASSTALEPHIKLRKKLIFWTILDGNKGSRRCWMLDAFHDQRQIHKDTGLPHQCYDINRFFCSLLASNIRGGKWDTKKNSHASTQDCIRLAFGFLFWYVRSRTASLDSSSDFP